MKNGDGESEVPPLAERRPVARKRVLFGGVTVHGLRRNVVHCQVRDISDTGARITLSRRETIPQQLYLIIIRDQLAYAARVAWRKDDEAGLAFAQAIDLRAPPDPAFAHLFRIWEQQKTDYLSWR